MAEEGCKCRLGFVWIVESTRASALRRADVGRRGTYDSVLEVSFRIYSLQVPDHLEVGETLTR
jgi:hypothetical protein